MCRIFFGAIAAVAKRTDVLGSFLGDEGTRLCSGVTKAPDAIPSATRLSNSGTVLDRSEQRTPSRIRHWR
jgi:hypothetical protein